MLVVEVLGNDDAQAIAEQLRALAGRRPVEVHVAARSERPAAIVLAADDCARADEVDAVVDSSGDVQRLWRERLEPYARFLAGAPVPSSPAVLRAWDPHWPTAAARRLRRLEQLLGDLDRAPFRFDHIGSTAVPSLQAKPILDLQVVVRALPDDDELRQRLLRVGFLPARGARPDSPGVTFDGAAGSTLAQLPKRLFHCPDPGQPAILHVRLAASPFAQDTVRFRDRLAADPAQRDRYAALKVRLADAHRDDRDYDDYTHGKSAFIAAAAAVTRQDRHVQRRPRSS